MIHRHITDWDDAYANFPNIPDSGRWPGAWEQASGLFREQMSAAGRARLDIPYGPRPRNRLDLFLPEGRPRGLVVFVHGGYWMRFERAQFSHFAAGPLAHGLAVAMPGYTLCPDIRIAGIAVEVARAIEQAGGLVDGPIRLAGHSAGGHLATRMVCAGSPLSGPTRDRIATTISISGVHDLRPLMRTANNATFGLDEAEALAESPALLRPADGVRLTCWVGASERSEFVRQSALLANVWAGLGAATALVAEPDRHHLDVIDGLVDPVHGLTRALVAD